MSLETKRNDATRWQHKAGAGAGAFCRQRRGSSVDKPALLLSSQSHSHSHSHSHCDSHFDLAGPPSSPPQRVSLILFKARRTTAYGQSQKRGQFAAARAIFTCLSSSGKTGKKPKAFELKFNGPQRGEIELSAYCAYTQCRQSVRIRNIHIYIYIYVEQTADIH